MALELLKTIEQAEAQAEEILQDASRKARELVVEAEKRGAIRAFLEVRVGNAAAIALYESRGYRKLRVRRKYYPDGEDAFVMSKRLFPPEEAKRAEANGEAL